jgi:preprotein translocase subunit SecD
VKSRSRIPVFVAVSLTVIAALFLGPRVWSVFVGDLRAAAVRFEVRLAEDSPASGLREAKVSGSHRSVYLHDEVIVINGDIAVARVVPGPGPSEYSVGIELKASGAEKMRAVTGNHIGKLLAILLDGQVVMAPVLRSPIGASARITGNFTRAQAERIVNGIEIQ